MEKLIVSKKALRKLARKAPHLFFIPHWDELRFGGGVAIVEVTDDGDRKRISTGFCGGKSAKVAVCRKIDIRA